MYGVPVSTLNACILGRPSRINAAAARQKIHVHEEEVLVAYLKETSCCGLPDTRKCCVRHANEILHACTGNPSNCVSRSSLDWILQSHHDGVRSYWSITLTI